MLRFFRLQMLLQMCPEMDTREPKIIFSETCVSISKVADELVMYPKNMNLRC